MALTISQLARAAGVGVETVRYYQRRNLLHKPKAARGGAIGIRHYSADDVRRLLFIRSAQRAGFALAEIGELLGEETTRQQVRTLAQSRIAELNAQIDELKGARGWLQSLVTECGTATEGPCPIIEAFTD